jgi:N-acetylmuramoyl-L-alanine amidase
MITTIQKFLNIGTKPAKPSRKIDYCVFHCTASPQTLDWRKLQWYFLKVLGWKREGYHVFVDNNGDVHRYIDDNEISNGVKEFEGDDIKIGNYNSVNICWEGGVDAKMQAIDNRTQIQKDKLRELTKEYLLKYPNIIFLAHHQVANKICPCYDTIIFLRSFGIPERNIYKGDNFNIRKYFISKIKSA